MNYRIAPRAEFGKMALTGGPPVVDRQDGPPVIRVQGGPPVVDRQDGPPVIRVQGGPPVIDRQDGPPVIRRRGLSERLNACLVGVLAAAALMAAGSAHAVNYQSFDLVWSPTGSATGSITGSITFDIDAANAALPQNAVSIPNWVSALTITAAGAAAGNGTWTLADFQAPNAGQWLWDASGVIFDFSQPLIGQGPGNGWANQTDASPFGDFGFGGVSGLTSTVNFEQDLIGGGTFRLTTFSPAAVPLPATLPLLGLGLVGVAALKRRKA
jgi:hypothetical protein